MKSHSFRKYGDDILASAGISDILLSIKAATYESIFSIKVKNESLTVLAIDPGDSLRFPFPVTQSQSRAVVG